MRKRWRRALLDRVRYASLGHRQAWSRALAIGRGTIRSRSLTRSLSWETYASSSIRSRSDLSCVHFCRHGFFDGLLIRDETRACCTNWRIDLCLSSRRCGPADFAHGKQTDDSSVIVSINGIEHFAAVQEIFSVDEQHSFLQVRCLSNSRPFVCSTKQSRFALQSIQQGSMGNQCLVPSSNFVEKCVRIDHRTTLSVTLLRFPDLYNTSWLRSKLDLYFALILAQNASWLLAIASPWRDVLTSALERCYGTDVWKHADTSRNW